MREYDKVLRDHVALVTRAADFAARRHSGQVRKGAAREPYLNHLAEVMISPPDNWERDRLIDYVDWAEKVVAGCRGINPRLDQLFDQTVTEARNTL